MKTKLWVTALLVGSLGRLEAALPRKAPRWMLSSFLELRSNQPERLLKIANSLFAESRIRQGSLDPQLAFEWQHRLAMVGALSAFFDPGPKKEARTMIHRQDARDILEKALFADPSLLVRDGAVESVRRILRMDPAQKKSWQPALEKAFLDPKNYIEGEGLFIRETILTVMRESSMRPSKRVRNAALEDKNLQVRDLLKNWKTSAFEDLSAAL